MEIQRIAIDHTDAVYRLVQQTIDGVYPDYYSAEEVEFSDSSIIQTPLPETS